MDQAQKSNWQYVAQIGLIAGIVALYTCAVGMVETFNDREVVRDAFTLGQVLLFAPPIIAAFYVASRTRKQGVTNPATHITNGVIIGAAAAFPLLLLIFLSNLFDLRDVFVNITRGLIGEILTFDQDNQLTGSLMLAGSYLAGSLIGSILILIPDAVRRAISTATIVTLIVGIMGELISLILEQLVSDDVLDELFRRGVLLLEPAIALFVIVFGLSLLWSYRGQQLKDSINGLPQNQQQMLQLSGFGFLGLFLLVLPLLVGTFLSEVLTNIGLFILMGLGLNIAIGLAGLLDLGYVTNFAVGAYIMGVLTSTGPLGFADGEVFNFWLVIPISLIAAMITGFLLAVPVLRMRGDYLAIATLGFGEIIGKLALSDWLKPIIGGAQGVLFIPAPSIFGFVLDEPEEVYYIILAACLVMLFISIRLNNSRVGRQWMAIREDEDVAAAMGIDVARSKLLAFTLSAASGGIAGAIFAAKLGTIFPNSFNLLISVNVLSLIIVGGMGSIPGVVVGAIVLIGLPELLREFSEFRLLLYGALLVIMMLSRPEGLWPSQVRRRELEEASNKDKPIPVPAGD